jgi:hypothetical protein
MPQRSASPDSSGPDGSSRAATLPDVKQLLMLSEEIENNAPYVWMDMLYKVAARHVADTATIMKDIQTDRSGKKIGTDIRNERVDREFFRTVINTSEVGLGAYMPATNLTGEALKSYPVSKGDVNKLKTQRERVVRDFGIYDRELTRLKQNKATHDAFIEASTGKKPDASRTSTGESGRGTTSPTATNPLGNQF